MMKTLLHVVNPSRALRPAHSGSNEQSLSKLVSIGSYRLIVRIEDTLHWLQARLRAGRSG